MSTTLVELSTLVDLPSVNLPGCPRALVLAGLEAAARTLCRSTGAWTETVAVTTTAGTLTYTVTLPTGAAVHALRRVLSGTRQVAANRCAWQGPSTLVLDDDPGSGTLSVELVCVPAGSQIPDWLAQNSADALQAGAVATRMLDAGKPWSSPAQAASVYQPQFNAGMARLRQQSFGRFAGASQTALKGVRVL